TTLTSFSGFVYTDEATPLSGVEVTLTDFTVFAATTDETGYFMIDNIFTGNYNLRVYKEGFEPYTGFIDISEEGNTMDFNLNISYAESFESSLPAEWYSTTSRSWFRDGNNAYDGSYSLKSGNISGNQTSNILVESNVATESIISFYYKVSSEAGYDLFKFYINGQLKGSWSGEVDWTYVEYTTNPGLNTYKWEYNKDIYTSDGSDAAWIDYVSLPQTITNNSDLDLVTAVDHQLSCYPNPFNPELNISFYQSAQNPISEISIYNLKGQKVKHFANILTSEGHQTVVWDGRDINKKSVASGIYFIKTKSEDMTTTHKVILMK
ncbi:MAG: T9SS type A sorting domain-containing protein, partial [Candidatus Cloacimonadales bacterium]